MCRHEFGIEFGKDYLPTLSQLPFYQNVPIFTYKKSFAKLYTELIPINKELNYSVYKNSAAWTPSLGAGDILPVQWSMWDADCRTTQRKARVIAEGHVILRVRQKCLFLAVMGILII